MSLSEQASKVEESTKRARRNTNLEAIGAEFLVLSHLLIHKVEAHKTYTNYPGYDIVAFNAKAQTTCRIQVKSREETGALGFPIRNFDFDFLVFVVLNRGKRIQGIWNANDIKEPDMYVLPIDVVKAHYKAGAFQKATFSKADLEPYHQQWSLILDWLGKNDLPDISNA